MRGDMWEPPVSSRWAYTRRIMVGYPGRPPVVVQQLVISVVEEAEGDTRSSS